MIPPRPLFILLFCCTFSSTPSNSSEEENALLGALKRVILSTAPAGFLKNLTRITLYRNLPAQTQVINFPPENGQIPQQRGMPNSFSSYPSSKPQQQTGLSLANPCDQPQQVGTGPYRIPRWFFNPSHSQCELFYWSGCCGNSNNFANREMCQRSCEVAPKSSSSINSAAIPSQYPTKLPQDHNTFIYLPTPLNQKATFSTTISPIDSELSHPQFPITPPHQGQQIINDGLPNPADWISLEGNIEEEDSEKELANWRRASSLIETTPLANPCAFGTNTNQMLLCQPAAPSICSGQQFCHVGDSPITTVCCNKPASVDVCHQPLNPGIGKSTLQRWYFYSPAGQCQTFTYRGLQGNENNFLSRVDCEQICPANPCAVGAPLRDIRGQLGYCSAAQQSICPVGFYCHVGGDTRTSLCCSIMAGNPCSQPMNAGQGFYQLQRWFWDAAAGCCRPFVYRGQKGNQNNFCSIEECNQACNVPPNPCRLPIDLPLQQCEPGPEACEGRSDLYCHVGASPETTICCPAEENRCQQPIELGEGIDQLPRFGYDSQNQQCHQFAYRGLKGNQNNFLSLEECEMACLPNPCPSGTPFVGADGRIQSCAVSTSMSTCPNGYWCHVGVNTARSTVCCPDANPNPCQLPMSTGDGFARLERFYFDPASKNCKSFIYKGLKGNQNNFLTLRACQLACLPLDNPCIGQPAKTASGQILFCSATNRDTCPVNFWCHLGAIPETTVCCPGATNPCSVPLAPGTGNAGLARWYYNADDRQCVSFQYNGKRGNQNNFLTQDECQNMCPAALCLLSIDRGSCSGRQTRYAFSREKSECIPFEYSGCGGNLNNFGTMQECQQICGNVRI